MTDSYNASERKDVRRAEKAARLADQQRLEVITGLMSTLPGRQWILGLLERAHVFATSMHQSALIMAFNEGERNFGLQLMNDLMASCPDKYIQMMRERNERDAAHDRESARQRDAGDDDSDLRSGNVRFVNYGDEADDVNGVEHH